MKKDYLDQPMLDLGDGVYATRRDFCQNILVTGAIGGGKSSGPGAAILTALARSEAGGIILCAKSSEADDVCAVLKKAGRERSILRWNGRNGGFNFLEWALARMGADGIGSVVEYLMRVIAIVRHASALGGSDGEAFWLDEFKRALRHLLLVVYLATGTLRMRDILSFMRSAPTSLAQFSDPKWQATRPFFYECFRLAADRIDAETGRQLQEYWCEFASMEGRLRTSILATFTMLDRFCHGWLSEATNKTSILPALCFHGVIIVLDMSRTTMGEDGVILQMIFKDAFQTEVLARPALPPIHNERLVFCYGDEAQEFWAASRDAEFFAMSRSSLCTTIYLTQSLNSIYTKMGGANAHDRGLHAIASMGIRVFCANHCTTTNTWASETIGKAIQRRASFNQSSNVSSNYGFSMGLGTTDGVNSSSGGSSNHSSGSGGSSSSSGSSWSSGHSWGSSENRGRNRGDSTSHGTSHGYSEAMELIVDPGFFARGLRTGGPAHGFRVTALWTQMARTFPSTGLPFKEVEFRQ